MCSRSPSSLAFSAVGACVALLAWRCSPTPAPEPAPDARVLRVCADSDNAPFSKRVPVGDGAGGSDGIEGIEGRLAHVLADELGARVEVTWDEQRRGFFRRTLNAKKCDVVLGVPAHLDMVLATKPYYRSSYVFVARAGTPAAAVRSLDDEALRALRVGVHLIGDDGANTPPAHALARRGVVDNVRGWPIVGDDRVHDPSALLEALARGEIDVAIAWGPLAGAWTRARSHASEAFVVTPVSPARDGPFPFAFDIAVGVRKGDAALRDALDRALAKRKSEIDALLDEHGVPRA